MSRTIQTQLSRLFLLGVLLSFALGLNYLNAWTAPTLAPTGGNVAAPLNTGGTTQTKSGGLLMSSLDITGTNGVSLVGGQLSFWNASTIVNPQYTIDMGDLDPGANNGIRFPDDTVQTTAGGGSASSVASAVGAGGLLPQNAETNVGSNWSVIYFFHIGELSGGDAKSGLGVAYKEGGVIKAVLGAPSTNSKTVNPVTTTKVCSNAGTVPNSNDFCVRLSGTDLLIHMGADSKGIYTSLK